MRIRAVCVCARVCQEEANYLCDVGIGIEMDIEV